MVKRRRSLDSFLARLAPRFGDRLRTDDEALSRVAGDESGLPAGAPSAVVWPKGSDEVSLLAREAAAHEVALVPRGGGTGKAGACIPAAGQVVVDLSRMNRILALKPQDLYAVIEPGVVTADLHRAAAAEGLMYPPDPASFESCTLGGNIMTNAGGPRAVKYGVTQRYVWGLEMVLMGGEVMRVGRRSIKGVAGYDLTSLIVGSEGTLALVTEATLHVIPAPQAVETAWLSFSDLMAASRAATQVFAAGILPRVMEVLDHAALDAVRPVSAFAVPQAGAALLVESDGSHAQAIAELLRLCEIAVAHGATDSAVAKSEREREAMRRARRLVSGRFKEAYPHKMSDDVAVPRSRMAELLDRAQAAGAAAGIPVAAYGHLGDGNLHLNLLCRTQDERERATPLRRQMLATAVAMGGTVTGEHGVGLTKRDQLSLEQSPAVIDLQQRIKRVFDPSGLLNPGKALPP